MNGEELISFIQNNVNIITTPVMNVAGALMTAIFLRKKNSVETSTQEFEKIKAGHLREVAGRLLESGEMSYTEYYKMNNFLDIAKKADNIYKNLPQKENMEVCDFDWFMRFYEATGMVSDIEVQKLWAKILAGEIYQQGSYSLRTLETLRNLSKTEAALFQTICSHSIEIGSTIFLPNYEDYMKFANIKYNDVLRLGDCGLIKSDGFLVLKMSLGTDRQVIFNNNELAISAQAIQDNVKMEIKQFPFTISGKELSQVIDIAISEKDIIQFGKSLKNGTRTRDLTFFVNHIISIDGNRLTFDEKNLLDDN